MLVVAVIFLINLLELRTGEGPPRTYNLSDHGKALALRLVAPKKVNIYVNGAAKNKLRIYVVLCLCLDTNRQSKNLSSRNCWSYDVMIQRKDNNLIMDLNLLMFDEQISRLSSMNI